MINKLELSIKRLESAHEKAIELVNKKAAGEKHIRMAMACAANLEEAAQRGPRAPHKEEEEVR